jgi:PKD repeat protein
MMVPTPKNPVYLEVLPGNQPPVADADGPYIGCEGQANGFDGSGSYDNDGTIISYLWDFGDGETSTDPNPTHMYDQDGIYSVSLTVTDDNSETDIDTTSAVIDDLNPVANFSVSPTSGPASPTVTFTDSSTSYDGLDMWLWDFGDEIVSNEQNPTHTYQEGTYNVSLTVWEFDGDSNTETKSNIINVSTPQPQVAYLIVRGSDDGIYYRIYNSKEDTWDNWNTIPGSTCDSPAATVCGNQLHVIVRGMDETSLYHGYVNMFTDEFSGWTLISGTTPSKPTLTSDENSLYLVIRGTDNRIYYRLYDLLSESWGDWNVVPIGTTVDSPAIAVDGDILHLVVCGMDDGLYHQRVYLPALDYLGWSIIGGTTPSAPTLTNNFKAEGVDHLLYLIVRGSDNGIYLRSYDGAWNNWASLPGKTNDAVGVCIQPPKPNMDAVLQVVVRGMNGGLYHGKYDLNSENFVSWNWISGETTSPPSLSS